MLSLVEDGDILQQIETDLSETQVEKLDEFLYNSGLLKDNQELHITFVM